MNPICGPSRGHYSKPVYFKNSGIKECIDEEYNELPLPEKWACEHPNHWQWGNGTRNGQKLYYPTQEMFVQKWNMTDKEFNEAVENYDMFSLEMKPRLICKNCAEHELSLKND